MFIIHMTFHIKATVSAIRGVEYYMYVHARRLTNQQEVKLPMQSVNKYACKISFVEIACRKFKLRENLGWKP